MASSLLELATQIQSMELSFTTILLEAAMKLASLTDANIFMIVDTQEGRRYGVLLGFETRSRYYLRFYILLSNPHLFRCVLASP